jgi:hypothetical protein
MSVPNYWNQMSGDTKASPFNQDNWSLGGNNGFMQNMNNDANKQDTRYGADTTNPGVGGGGYWSGGRPGAGSWMESMQAAAPAAAPAPVSDMVPGARAQMPGDVSNSQKAQQLASTAYAGPWDYANFDWQAYAAANPDVLATNYGGGNTWGNSLDQMWHHYTSANQSGELRNYIGYQDGRVSPYTGIAQNSGSYVGPAASNWSSRVAAPAPAAPTNPWISGGGSSRMNVRQY